MTRPSLKHLFPEPIEFDWDEGNAQKNWDRHHVSQGESESIFFNEPTVVCNDSAHAKNEMRYMCLGKTRQGRYLFISFTVRNDKIRVISARDMTDREHKEFRKYEKDHSSF
ncbi:MAG TPA: BrnT family toxin [Candidatus Ozemobacteraceae bacterium]|nr:BrnT family toxin [Candidatus Ozemobacteraceae bacterium]